VTSLKAILPIGINVTVMFVHYTQTAEDLDTISFTYGSPGSLLDRVKI